MMKAKKLAVAAIAFCILIALAFLLPDNSSTRTLRDGTILVLSELHIGPTNVYRHGTWLSKTLGRFAPSNGLGIASYKLQRPKTLTFGAPTGYDQLAAQFQLLPGSPREKTMVLLPFYRKYRLLISGTDDFAFVKEFNGFTRESDGLFAYVSAQSFPRQSKLLRFRLEERDANQSGDWREVTTFLVRNPKIRKPQAWPAERRSRLKLADDLELQVGELEIVRNKRINPSDIWEHLAYLPIRVTQTGQVRTNWGLHNGPIEDTTGNLEHFTFGKVITNDWMVYKIFRPLDPDASWKFRVAFALDSDFPSTNLFSFAVPWPMTANVFTNLGGYPLRIGFVSHMLDVELTGKPPDRRLTFVTAVNDWNDNLDGRTGSWGQHSFRRTLKLSTPTQVHVTVAIHTNYMAEFTLAPQVKSNSDSRIGDGSSSDGLP